MASAASDFSGPYCVYRPATVSGDSPVDAPRIDSRFDTPGLRSGSKRTSLSVSVTARLIFFAVADRSSRINTVPATDVSDFDILRVGSWRSITRAPAGRIVAPGTRN